MSDEEMRVAIAEACGWHYEKGEYPSYYGTFKLAGWVSPSGKFHHSDWERKSARGLPDYLNDLDAMHEAEQTLTADQFEELFYYWLAYAVSHGKCGGQIWEYRKLMVHATARHRAEAFLRTIGKWKEEA